MKTNATSELKSLIQKELNKIEDKIATLEKIYIEETCNYGNILKGWDMYLNMKKTNSLTSLKKNTKISDKNRVFSLTSTTSKAYSSVKN